MAPRMGPSFEKGRRRAIVWPLVAVLIAVLVSVFYFEYPGDGTPTDAPLKPASQGDIQNPETEVQPGRQ